MNSLVVFGTSPAVRRWLYGVLLVGLPLLIAYGIVNKEDALLWIAFGGAILGQGTASAVLTVQHRALKVHHARVRAQVAEKERADRAAAAKLAEVRRAEHTAAPLPEPVKLQPLPEPEPAPAKVAKSAPRKATPRKAPAKKAPAKTTTRKATARKASPPKR